jgi:hypothetical protein
MKRTIWLFIITFVCVTFVYAQDGWVSHKADNRISVKFPGEPKVVIAGTFATHDKDSLGYALTVIDFVAVAGIDSVTLAPLKDTPQFAAQLKQGMGSSLPGVVLDDFTIGKWKGFTSYTTAGVSSTQKTKMYMFMVLIGNKMYSLSTVVPDGKSSKGRDNFFSSLTLTN